MSTLRAKAVAQKRFTELTTKLGFRPQNVNLRRMNANQINAINEDLEAQLAEKPTRKAPRPRMVKKDRSKVIKQIKEIDPTFKASRSDTYNDLLRIQRTKGTKRNLPFITELKTKTLKQFLENPIDENEYETDAITLVANIQYMAITSDYYLVMQYIEYDEDGTPLSTEYKVIRNIDEIKDLLKHIGKGEREVSAGSGYGSDTDAIVMLLKYGSKIILTWYAIETYKRLHSGAYFKYFHKTCLDLSRYQVFRSDQDSRKADEHSCLIWALMQSGKVSEYDLDNLKLSLFHREIKSSDIKLIAKQLNITIGVRYDAKHAETIHNKGCAETVSIGLVDNHWFLNEPTNITKFALDRYEDVKDDKRFPMIPQRKDKKPSPLTSFQVINTLFTKYKDSLLEAITLDNVSNKQSVDKTLSYLELRSPVIQCKCTMKEVNQCYKTLADELCRHRLCRVKSLLAGCTCKAKEKNHEVRDYSFLGDKMPFKGMYKKNSPNDNYEIWFVDTETFIHKRKGFHVAYALCAIKYSKQSKMFIKSEFYGLDCVKQFLDSLKTNCIIYAHNMGFDFRQFVDHLYELQTPIETGTKLKQIQAKYQKGTYQDKDGKERKSFIHLLFKDSYAFLATKLSKLPKMFNLDTGGKDIYPYTLINEYNYGSKVSLDECYKHLKKADWVDFAENAKRVGALDGSIVDIKKYTIHYCMQDTLILAKAFIKFREQVQLVCKLDIVPRVSLPQLADDYLKSMGVYDNCFSFSGITQDFIRKCCVGGRVMMNSNQKWHIKDQEDGTLVRTNVSKQNGCANEKLVSKDDVNSGPIQDFDAVSLYPSAMSQLKGFPMGIPKVLTKEQLSVFDTIKNEFDAFYVEIKILNHKVERQFPLLSVKEDGGIRNFTNNIDDKTFFVDQISLDDLVEFQGIEYEVLRGYYFDSGMNTKINEVITFMFNKRLELKAECSCGLNCGGKKCGGNPLQNVYKLLMNSAYGKTIQKAIATSKSFIDAKELRKYVSRRHKYIDTYSRVNDDLFVIKERKSIIKHFTACHVASNILSMSKRIMNRVICTAEDNGLMIYYQDTDSMHLHGKAIPVLREAFNKRYNYELIGEDMCQFHSDFEVSEKGASNIRAVESIFIGKKCYIDKLAYETADASLKYNYHIRMKGIPSQSIRDNSDDYIETYTQLWNGVEMEFDLKAYCPLQVDKDYRARANTRLLSRTLRF